MAQLTQPRGKTEDLSPNASTQLVADVVDAVCSSDLVLLL